MDVKKVANLAHLEISDEEIALYSPQMEGIVAYVEQLNELDTGDIAPMTGGLTAEGAATKTDRDDSVVKSLTPQQALEEAPAAVDEYFQVPKVL